MPVITGISRRGNRARHDLLVESPQIFERTAAARHDHHVREFRAIEIPQSRHDFPGGAFALHLHGIKLHVHVGEAPLQHAQNVANRRAGGRRDHADASRQHRQRLLARLVEESFVLKFFLQLLEGELQRAQAHGLDVADVNLIFAARFVDAERAADGDVQAVLGAEFQQPRLIAETDAANLRSCVLQSEIEMAGLRRVVIRDFAFDPHIRKRALEQIADALGQLADFPDVPLGREIEK